MGITKDDREQYPLRLQRAHESIDNLINRNGLVYHHSASEKGYAAALNVPWAEEYKGRFGKGIIVHTEQKHNRSNYYKTIEYWIAEESEKWLK